MVRLLSGWGRTAPSSAEVVRPEGVRALNGLLVDQHSREWPTDHPSIHNDRDDPPRMIPRGLGRSYGDAAQCAGGRVIDTSELNYVGPVNPQTGVVEVGGGARLEHLMRRALLTGWFVPAVPGTRHVTVGGAIAADVHGKNHHRDGSFGQHIVTLTLVTPTGRHRISPTIDPELFWATVGGMGLTGVVTSARIQLVTVATPWMAVATERFGALDEVMAAMTDAEQRYSVAWLDCTTPSRHRGRSVMTLGDHVPADEVPPSLRDARPAGRSSAFGMPFVPPVRLVRSRLLQASNAQRYWRTPRRRSTTIEAWWPFFFPLDGIANWNRLYGPAGFVQYQFAVGNDRGDVLHQAVSQVAAADLPCTLAVLKRLGAADPGLLSFPMDGWTLALDFPVGPPALPNLLDRLDGLVADAGGRVYLAKDGRLRPDVLGRMYPRLAELAAVRRRVDPRGVVQSDLSRRLGLEAGRS